MPELQVLPPTNTILGPTAKRKRDSEEKAPERKHSSPRKRPHLNIQIPSLTDSELEATTVDVDDLTSTPLSGLSDPDSLFDEPIEMIASSESSVESSTSCCDLTPALLTGPPIQGLFFAPDMRLSDEIAKRVTRYCLDKYFQAQGVNQVMLFGRFHAPESTTTPPASATGLPPVLLELLSTLETMLRPMLPEATHTLLFPRVPTQARQAILNLYQPGEGITPHVDLLQRFGDGIIGVSFASGCVMQFAKVKANNEQVPEGTLISKDSEGERESWDVYLPHQSVIVLSEDARYRWTHGIGKHKQDFVQISGADPTVGRWIERGVRLSVTFRWLLPGADVVGENPSSP